MLKVLNIHRPSFLGDKGNKSSIEAPFKLTSSMKLIKEIHNIFFYDSQQVWKKAKEKPSGPRALSPFRAFITIKEGWELMYMSVSLRHK